MRILILTQYFPPETGAPQNRLFEIALRLKDAGDEITVLTAMPNYPKMRVFEGYRWKLFATEEIQGIKVFRSFIYVSKSKAVIARLLNYFSFVISSFLRGLFLFRKFDYVICESPPLFLGITAVFLSRLKRAKLIFNVSDLWPESAEKLGIVTNKFLLNNAEKLELWLYKKSFIVSGQTQGILESIKARSAQKNLFWLPNGVDPEFYKPELYSNSWRFEQGFQDDDLLILYAGIIGHAQGLDVIVKAAALTKENVQIKWLLVGDGPVKSDLEKLVSELKLQNVYFFPNQEKKNMPFIVKACDITAVPLKKLPLFLGAIPSKIFENLAMEVPVLLGVEGEAKTLFIENGNAGLAFEPENEVQLAEKAVYLFENRQVIAELGKNGRKYVDQYFNRNTLAIKFRDYLVSFMNGK